MATNEVRRNYNMIDAELCMFTSNLCNFLTRDIDDFATFGVTAPKIAALKALGDAFEVFPTDGSLVGDVMITTEDKNALREQVLATIREMAARVEAKWGISSGKYRRLDLRNPSQMSDDSLLIAARTVHTKLTDYLLDLADYGLTEAMLDDFETLIEDFENAKNDQADTIAMRDEKTLERITKGNEIYALVSTYCSFGKILYEKTNPAKYDDYIIYTSVSPGSLTAPENLQYDQITGRISWNSVDNATSYKVEISFESGEFEEIYADIETETYYVPPSSPSNFIIRAMGRNSGGLGPASNLTVNYNPPLQPPGYMSLTITNPSLRTIAINWGDSVGATSYRLYKSSVALSAPPAEFSLVGEYANTSYNGTVNAATRNYFYVVAVKGEETSAPSDVGYIDML